MWLSDINGAGENQVQDGQTTADEAQKPASKGKEPDGMLKKLDNLRIRAVALINMRASPGLQVH